LFRFLAKNEKKCITFGAWEKRWEMGGDDLPQGEGEQCENGEESGLCRIQRKGKRNYGFIGLCAKGGNPLVYTSH